MIITRFDTIAKPMLRFHVWPEGTLTSVTQLASSKEEYETEAKQNNDTNTLQNIQRIYEVDVSKHALRELSVKRIKKLFRSCKQIKANNNCIEYLSPNSLASIIYHGMHVSLQNNCIEDLPPCVTRIEEFKDNTHITCSLDLRNNPMGDNTKYANIQSEKKIAYIKPFAELIRCIREGDKAKPFMQKHSTRSTLQQIGLYSVLSLAPLAVINTLTDKSASTPLTISGIIPFAFFLCSAQMIQNMDPYSFFPKEFACLVHSNPYKKRDQ